MEKIKKFISKSYGKLKSFFSKNNAEIFSRWKRWTATIDGQLVLSILFFPYGGYLLWKKAKLRNSTKIVITLGILFALFGFLTSNANANDYTSAKAANDELQEENSQQKENIRLLNSDLQNLKTNKKEYAAYKKKMSSYENLAEEEAKKKTADLEAINSVKEKINKLPSVSFMNLSAKSSIEEARKSYDGLTDEQKQSFDLSKLEAAEAKIAELTKAEEEQAAAAKKAEEEKAAAEQKKKEEEAKGYDTGITYDQLARTPDDYLFKKAKFYGKVVQIMEDDEETTIRLAVDGNIDTVIYGQYKSDLVSQRVLEDDFITISGISSGLVSYKATIGGKITIPSMSIQKIDQ